MCPMCPKGNVVETISFCYHFIKIGPHFQLMIQKHSASIYGRRACVLSHSLPGMISEARHPHGAKQKLLTLGTSGAAQEHPFLEGALGTEERGTASLVQNWWDVRNISAPLCPSDVSKYVSRIRNFTCCQWGSQLSSHCGKDGEGSSNSMRILKKTKTRAITWFL